MKDDGQRRNPQGPFPPDAAGDPELAEEPARSFQLAGASARDGRLRQTNHHRINRKSLNPEGPGNENSVGLAYQREGESIRGRWQPIF